MKTWAPRATVAVDDVLEAGDWAADEDPAAAGMTPDTSAVAAATNTIDTVRLAVLAALNIADEYHLIKKNQNPGTTDYRKRTHQLVNALDEILQDDRRAG